MSFTIASHVAIFIAMFISPAVGISVVIGTTIGFVFSGLPIDVWLRAASHIVFTAIGAFWVHKNPSMLDNIKKIALLGVVLSVIHAVGEVAVILPLYFGAALKEAVYDSGFFKSVVALVGGGTFVHSMVDFAFAIMIWKALRRTAKNLLF